MESKEVESLVGKEVYWEKGKVMADIIGYSSGWVQIKTDDGEEHKVRAKDITLMDSDEDIVVEGGELATTAPDPLLTSSKGSLGEDGLFSCQCGADFKPGKEECFKCPECGAWHMVRLHPDLERYVKGLAATPSGRDSVDVNDSIASYLRACTIIEAYKKVEEALNSLHEEAWFTKPMQKAYGNSTGTMVEFLDERYGHLNNGMIRMNLGNLLRGANKRNQVIEDEINAKKEGGSK